MALKPRNIQIDSTNENEKINSNKMMKITVSFWIEGWDADYFYGITSSNELARTMQSYFEFTYVEV
jgi:hypothetical protein